MRHPQWTRILDSALDRSNSQADDRAVDLVQRTLATLARFGFRSWVLHLHERWHRDAIRLALKARAKQRDTVLVSHDGQLISRNGRRGVKVSDSHGRERDQQVLFTEMTWPQFHAWRAMNSGQIASLGINEVIAGKIAPLQDLVPDSTGPADALAHLGMTLDEVLAS